MDRFPPLAVELVGLGVDVIVVTIEPAVRAAREASPTIPIVMAGASVDPVGAGLVASLARPGGKITGATPCRSRRRSQRALRGCARA